MIITCPSCSTRYLLPPAALSASGRDVRCARCGHVWFQAPPADLPRTVDLIEPLRQHGAGGIAAAEPVRNLPGPPLAPARHGAALGWLLFIVVLAGGLGAAALYRDRIVEAWPPSGKLFELVGLPVTAYGLSLSDPVSERSTEGSAEILTVSGTIQSTLVTARPVPPVWVSLTDGGGRVLRRELAVAEPAVLPAGGEARYKVRFAAPPTEATRVAVTFGETP
ncbi:DUF3426 domain-containing protein [Zavarzinia compransoris]|uniref:Zinc finger/thioredoxin putative domain-containing protein n=1 Tax=Zavarzinia compransoris TaxID=1264899 RepID=A0A317E827_9PROT|nr:DUF3426 domain-containing protein [Zavarzinia compransoris]PWR22406.1 hypothetical protein DKG75_07095 [Zavarzinia compransoris]TDP45455.1 putative Zn finger-like uncharacterized protein [Zavarzinia compransoris]